MIKINARSPFYLDVDAEVNIEPPTQQTQTIQVKCGSTHNTGTDVGNTIYEFNTEETGNVTIVISGNDVPIRYKVEWDGVEQSDTKFIGLNIYDDPLLAAGVAQSDIATASPSNKNRTITFNKTTSTPSLVKVTAFAPLTNDQYSLQFTCPTAPISIDGTTQINIWFDSSGSMNATLPHLQNMVANELKACLVQFYDNDSAKYDKYVSVRDMYFERTFKTAIEIPSVVGATKVWNFIFQDESEPMYHESIFDNQIRTSTFEYDIIQLRLMLNANPTGYVIPVIFQVEGYPEYKEFLQAVENEEGRYVIPYSLSDLPDQSKFYYDVIESNNAANYYRDLIIQAVNDLGFTINCP
jgi:hypothetical protein